MKEEPKLTIAKAYTDYWNVNFNCDNPKFDGTLYVKYTDFPKLMTLLEEKLKENNIDCFSKVTHIE